MARSGDFIEVILEDNSGTLQTFANGDITSVDLGLTYDQYDVSGFGSSVHKMLTGKLQAPVTIKGFLTTGSANATHTVFKDIHLSKRVVTLKVAIGNNIAPAGGDPQYTGDFYVTSYVPALATGGAVTFTATLVPAIDTAPAWGSKP